jgi:beta-fructofuranosidase
VNGFPNGRGWNGCLSLPRALSLSRDGQLRQKPAPQLSKLRGKGVTWKNVPISRAPETLSLPATNTLEIEAEIDLQSATSINLQLKSGGQNPQMDLHYNGLELRGLDAVAPLHRAKGDRKLQLRIFIDRSVLEVFANETVCLTKRIDPLEANAVFVVRAEGGQASAKRIQAWPMKTIW